MRRTVCVPIVFAVAFLFSVRQSNGVESSTEAELAKLPDHLLFESYVGDNWELMRMRPDGSDQSNVTNTPEIHELYPQASPDGQHICFLVDSENEGQTTRSIYVMRADGTERKRIAKDARQPCWHPDGTKIAYVPQEFPKFNIKDFVSKGLRIYDLTTGQTTDAPASDKIQHLYNLCWSPDGRWIIATVHGGMGFGHAIIAIDWREGTVIDLKLKGCRPCLSGDGQRIAWSENDHTVCTARMEWQASGPRVTDKKTVDQREKMHLYHPDLSPDGRYVTYSVGPGGRVPRNGPGTHTEVAEMVGVRGKWNIYVRAADGSGPAVKLTSDDDASNKESEWLPGF